MKDFLKPHKSSALLDNFYFHSLQGGTKGKMLKNCQNYILVFELSKRAEILWGFRKSFFQNFIFPKVYFYKVLFFQKKFIKIDFEGRNIIKIKFCKNRNYQNLIIFIGYILAWAARRPQRSTVLFLNRFYFIAIFEFIQFAIIFDKICSFWWIFGTF